MLSSLSEFILVFKKMKGGRIFESDDRFYLAGPWGTESRELSADVFDQLLNHRAVYQDRGMGMELNPAAIRILEEDSEHRGFSGTIARA